jgi:hypothetical protein
MGKVHHSDEMDHEARPIIEEQFIGILRNQEVRAATTRCAADFSAFVQVERQVWCKVALRRPAAGLGISGPLSELMTSEVKCNSLH